MDDKARVKSILEASEHMVMATADAAGKPWVTPILYAFDDDNTLYWMSSKSAQHSSNIRARPEVSIVIYMTEPTNDAVYIDAIAEELVDEDDIVSAVQTRNSRKHPSKWKVKTAADVSGKAAWRIYKATPKDMYFRVESELEGQPITQRRKIV